MSSSLYPSIWALLVEEKEKVTLEFERGDVAGLLSSTKNFLSCGKVPLQVLVQFVQVRRRASSWSVAVCERLFGFLVK